MNGGTTDCPYRKKMKVDSIFISYININSRCSKYLHLKDKTKYVYMCMCINVYTHTFIHRTP